MGMRRAELTAASVIAAVGPLIVVAVAWKPVDVVAGFALFGALGYAWTEVAFGSRIAGLERAAVTVGLAMGVPIIGGLLLSSWGVLLHRATWAMLLGGATLMGVVIVIVRRESGSSRPLDADPHSKRRLARMMPRHVLALAAAAVLAIGAVALSRFGAEKQEYGGFTELWLSAHGTGGESLGVKNDEGATTRYRLVLLRNGRFLSARDLKLADGATWRETVSGRFSLSADLYRYPDLKRIYRAVDTGSASS